MILKNRKIDVVHVNIVLLTPYVLMLDLISILLNSCTKYTFTYVFAYYNVVTSCWLIVNVFL